MAIPCVAPIALEDFYSYNGMNFYEYMGKKLKFMFFNHPLVYMSTERDLAIKEYQIEQLGTGKKKKGKAGKQAEPVSDMTQSQKAKNQEKFEAKKTKRILFVNIEAIVAAIAGLMAYKYISLKSFNINSKR